MVRGLSIKYVGQSMLTSPYLSSKTLSLKHLLHVPYITKDLLSVSKFAKDNIVFFEFHPSSCFVKDRVTKTTLLEGILKGGLYVFDHTRIDLRSQLHPNSFGFASAKVVGKSQESKHFVLLPLFLYRSLIQSLY